MKIPKSIQPLIEDGIVDAVVRQLKSGKEASVYVVRCGNDIRCAKVYKEAAQRSFQHSVLYQEGRKERNSRRARAMEKRTRFGKEQMEQAWQTAEVEALYRLAAAGVRVPRQHGFFDGVLLMELVTDDHGQAAPRLNDVDLTDKQARDYHQILVQQVVLMLCAGLVHGDLSEFNVLLAQDGPVIIDLPQAVDAAGNNHAFSMLQRDVDNLATYFGQFAPELLKTNYALEIWQLYEAGKLVPGVILTGVPEIVEHSSDVESVLREIDAAQAEHLARIRRMSQDEVDADQE